jgi:hypothetical protein
MNNRTVLVRCQFKTNMQFPVERVFVVDGMYGSAYIGYCYNLELAPQQDEDECYVVGLRLADGRVELPNGEIYEIDSNLIKNIKHGTIDNDRSSSNLGRWS